MPTPHIDPLVLLRPRWVLPVLEHLRDGPLRYTELLHCVHQGDDQIPSKSLSTTLRELRSHHLVEQPAGESCVYRLTVLGHQMLDQFDMFAAWVFAHLDELNLDPEDEGFDPDDEGSAARVQLADP